MSQRQRNKNRRNHEYLKQIYAPKSICRNCGEAGSHYAPPSHLCAGFYTCEAKELEGDLAK